MNITIVCADTRNRQKALSVMEHMVKIFPFKKAIFFSNEIESETIDIIPISTINNKSDYSKFILLDLPQYIDTDFVLIVQHDGFILNPHKWRREFLSYDYIGAPWLRKQTFFHGGNMNNIVGNGGFSLRSKKFLNVCEEHFKDKHISDCEDIQCCITEYDELIKRGIKFAPIDLAFKFSIEDVLPQNFSLFPYYKFEYPFGFHNSEADPTFINQLTDT